MSEIGEKVNVTGSWLESKRREVEETLPFLRNN